MGMWDNIKRIDSSDTNVFKYVFTADSAVAESGLYRYGSFEDRTVICCSTQSGCPVGCRFCGAGDFFARSLTTEEIISQPEHLLADMKLYSKVIKRFQIMFMSMGEPLLNLKALIPAMRYLAVAYPNARLLISTSAPRIDMVPLYQASKEIPQIGLQFSIHESTDEKRDALIPFTAKLSLSQIALAGEVWAAAVADGRRPFFNYCAHEHNSGAEDADRILALFKPDTWEATISVVCERDENVAAANARQRELAASFQSKLIERGYSTRMFDPAGQDDIGGGCGQLWFVQKWAKDHAGSIRESVGASLPIVHAPALR